MQFNELKLLPQLLKAVEAEGYTTPSPIQQQAIPPVLEGRDVLGIAQTGTGKTAAFALPILHRLFLGAPVERPETRNEQNGRGARNGRRVSPHPHRKGVAPSRRAIRAMVLAPTRELATQIAESFRTYGRQTSLRTAVVFGGVGAGAQIQALQSGIDILIACPGRLLDLMSQGHVYLGGLQTLVLDEADRMLDMGFAPDIRRILAQVPTNRQTLLFSATMPSEIQRLADDLLRDPIRVEIAAVSTPAERVVHSTYFVRKNDKTALLQRLLTCNDYGLPGDGPRRVLVFARTKRGADRVAEKLSRAGIKSEAIHGNKSQGQRERTLENFRRGTSPVMVATDLAARGLDVDNISHVINFDLPNEPETFVHRIGRTARAGASGYAISFCDAEEGEYLVDIEHLIQQALPKEHEHPHHCPDAHAAHATHRARKANKLAGIATRPAPKAAAPRGRSQQSAGPSSGNQPPRAGRRNPARFEKKEQKPAQSQNRRGASSSNRRDGFKPAPRSRHPQNTNAPSSSRGPQHGRTMHTARWQDED